MSSLETKVVDFAQELRDIRDHTMSSRDYDYGMKELAFWRDQAADMIEKAFGKGHANALRKFDIPQNAHVAGEELADLTEEKAVLFRNHYNTLDVFWSRELREVFTDEERRGLTTPAYVDEEKPMQDSKQAQVFIVFGHDEQNALALQKMLLKSWSLEAIFLKDVPGQGRTIIEKFEQVADGVNYAFALMTPDDSVQLSGRTYDQARPNVLFELGWFCGKIGRSKVCLLFKKGTAVPSDLKGIERLEFDKAVTEKHLEIQGELRSAGVI